MTLQKRIQSSNAVFDFPPVPSLPEKTITRRIASLATRSFLSIRNLPVQTSQNPDSPKCFSNGQLYKYRPVANKKNLCPFFPAYPLKKNLHDLPQPIDKSGELPWIYRSNPRFKLIENICIDQKTSNSDFLKLKTCFRAPKIREVDLKRENFSRNRNEFEPILKRFVAQFEPPENHSIFNNLSTAISVPEKIAASFSGFRIKPARIKECQAKSRSSDFFFSPPPNPGFLSLTGEIEACPGPSTFFTHFKKRIEKILGPKITIYPENVFETRFDLGKNLILEAKSRTEAKPGKLLPKELRPGNLHAFLKRDKGFHPKEFYPKGSFTSKKFTLEDIPRPKIPRIFPNRHKQNVFKPLLFVKSLCGTHDTAFHKTWPGKNFLRLKLRLKKSCYAETAFEMRLLHDYRPKAFVEPQKDLKVQYTQMPVRTVSAQLDPSINANGIMNSLMPASFCSRKHLVYFLAKNHARYCIKLLKKAIGPTLPIPASFLPLSRQFLRGRLSPERSCPKNFAQAVGVFSDTVQMLGRANIFLMSLTNLNFTDICLPGYRRRLKSPPGLFKNSVTRTAPAIHNRCLSRLRLSFPVKLAFSQAIQKRRFLAVSRESFEIKLCHPLKAENQNSFLQTKPRKWPKRFLSFLNLPERFELLTGVPSSAKSELELTLSPILPQTVVRIEQKTIVPPPDWHKAIINFNCRLRLLPYPFGFPSFVFPDFKNRLLDQFEELQISTGSESQALTTSGYAYQLNRRSFRSKFSLKNPVKWLFPSLPGNIANYFKTQYHNLAEPVFLAPDEVPKPEAFAFSWQNLHQKTYKLTFNTEKIAASENASKYKNASFELSFPDVTLDFTHLPETKACIKRQRISRILVKHCIAPSVQHSSDSFTLNLLKAKGVFRLAGKNHIELKHYGHLERLHVPDPKAVEILAFYNCFSDFETGKLENSYDFKALFRQFLFPWAPAYSSMPEFHPSFFEVDDTSILTTASTGEEIRVSQLLTNNFSESEIKLKSDFVRRNFKKFIPASKKLFEFFFNLAPISFNLRAFAASSLITPNSHWVPRFAPRFNICMKLARQIEEPGKIAQARCPGRFAFLFHEIAKAKLALSRNRQRNFSRLNLDSPHWIILLQNFLEISKMNTFWSSAFSPSKDRLPEYQIAATADPEPFHVSAKTPRFAFSPPTIPLFFSTMPEDALKARQFPAQVKFPDTGSRGETIKSFRETAIFTKRFETQTAFVEHYEEKNDFKFCREFKNEIKTFNSADIRLIEFKMQDRIERNAAGNAVRGRKLRPRQTVFKLSYIPDWFDMEMQHVDLSL